MEIEIPDNEELACVLDVVEARLVRQGQYGAACDVISAQRRLRLDDDEKRRMEAEIAELRAKLDEAERAIGGLKHFIGEQADQIGTLEVENEALRADLEFMAANSARTSTDYRGRWHVIFRALKSIPYDGTPDDLRRVIREARLRGEG